MAKLARKMFAQFFSFSDTATTADWSVLGHDVDALSVELNPDTATSKNILGESTFVHNGFAPEIANETFYANPEEPIYEKLLAITMNRDNSEANCLGYYVEAVFDTFNEETKVGSGVAYVQRAWCVPQSAGGDTAGFNIPFNINPVGNRTKMKISYDANTYTPTFSAMTETP